MKVTQREKEIIQLVADEYTTREIANQLYISDHTVISHRKNLMEKLQVRNTAGLVRKGFDIGLLRISVILILILQISNVLTSQETIIGFEVDKTHDVLFGVPLDSVGNSFYWSSSKGSLIVGTDDAFFNTGPYELDSIGNWSAVFGLGNKMYGTGSITWGEGNTIEHGTLQNTAFGFKNKIASTASGSTVWGSGNTSKSNLVTGWGTKNLVGEDALVSTVWGANNIIEKNASLSTVWGSFNKSNAPSSTIWGINNTTDNIHTTAFGQNNRAGGNTSTVMGLGNIAKGYASLVTGTYCDTLNGQADQNAFFDTTPLFVIGNGTGEGLNQRSNALTVFGSGRMKLGSGSAGTDLHIKQSETIIHGGTGGIRLESTLALPASSTWQIYNSGTNFSFAKNGNRRAYIAENGAFVDDENFAPDNGEITKSKIFTNDDILKLEIRSTSQLKSKKEVKLNAYQILQDFPELVINDEKGEPFGIDYKQLYLMAIAALQEEIKTNIKQQNEIDILKAAILK